MRGGLSTIQQTLTAEAAAVLNRSIAEAARRGHGQTTPLHVAATLLSSPSSILRNACARSHHASAHPLHCRALDLCFSVALDRLPSSINSTVNGEQQQMPPVSNALMAALKRAQAHQRRGCPEQQQQPILAVKVELEQLVISILDDPGVSRVMREASFSSPAVKLAIEQSISSSTTTATSAAAATTSSIYVSQRVSGEQQKDDIKRVMDVLVKTKKRNPILVGDNDPSSVIKEALRCIESGDAPASLIGVKIVSVETRLSSCDKVELSAKIRELNGIVEAQIGGAGSGGGIVLDLGDLKWLVENGGQQQTVSEAGRAAVEEMGRLVARYGGGGRLWLVGRATCPTYLRCQVYYPSMEADWDLQAVPVTARFPPSLPRSGGSGILSSSIESLSPAAKGFPAMPLKRPGNITAAGSSVCVGAHRTALCSQCAENYEHELGKLAAEELENSSSESQSSYPMWLQIAPPTNQSQAKDKEEKRKQSAEELKKKWVETCARTHMYLNAGGGRTPAPQSTTLSMANPFSLIPQPRQNLKTTLSQPSHRKTPVATTSSPVSPPTPSSPVRTDLALGRDFPTNRLRDFSSGCLQDQAGDNRSDNKSGKGSGIVDIDSFKKLFTGLTEKVKWQPEAASAVATTVMQVKSGYGKRRSCGLKSDTWLLFVGPDKVGKRRMAAALSELVCGSEPITINLWPRSEGRESELSLRGKTSVDRIVEAVRSNPFSVVHLEEFDRADAIVLRTIERAIESGRLPDSYGREISLGSVIFILSSSWVPDDLKNSQKPFLQSEEKALEAADGRWQLELIVGEQSPEKRRAQWICEGEPPAKRAGLSLDLNLSVRTDEEAAAEGSRNSSDVTVEHDHNHGGLAINHQATSLTAELFDAVDEAIIFKPVDFGPLRSKLSDSLSSMFASIAGTGKLLLVDGDALDRLVGGVWLAGGPAKFDEWAERILVPSFYQVKGNLKSDDGLIVRLSVTKGDDCYVFRAGGDDWLPKSVLIRPEACGR